MVVPRFGREMIASMPALYTSDDLAQQPQSLIGCEPGREVPSFIPPESPSVKLVLALLFHAD
jgi:hypothetical protein